jgi:hypothetical protein
VITLNLDPSFYYGASSTTSLLHFLRQPLFLGLTDPDKSCDNCHGLPSPVGGRTKDIHPLAISFWWGLISYQLDREQGVGFAPTAVSHP